MDLVWTCGVKDAPYRVYEAQQFTHVLQPWGAGVAIAALSWVHVGVSLDRFWHYGG